MNLRPLDPQRGGELNLWKWLRTPACLLWTVLLGVGVAVILGFFADPSLVPVMGG